MYTDILNADHSYLFSQKMRTWIPTFYRSGNVFKETEFLGPKNHNIMIWFYGLDTKLKYEESKKTELWSWRHSLPSKIHVKSAVAAGFWRILVDDRNIQASDVRKNYLIEAPNEKRRLICFGVD